jgi:hypothetical protein
MCKLNNCCLVGTELLDQEEKGSGLLEVKEDAYCVMKAEELTAVRIKVAVFFV